jgi:hypothetical protein
MVDHCARSRMNVDWTKDAMRSAIVEIVGSDVDGRGCREYVNCTVDGDGRCCVSDILLSAYHLGCCSGCRRRSLMIFNLKSRRCNESGL